MIALALEQFHLPAHRLLWAEQCPRVVFVIHSAVWHWREEIMRRTDLVAYSKAYRRGFRSLSAYSLHVATFRSLPLAVMGFCLTSLEGRMRMTAAIAVIGQFIRLH